MTTKHKPATPLPWEPSDKYTPIAPYIQSEQDEDYACHAANAYPRLVEALHNILRSGLDEFTHHEMMCGIGEGGEAHKLLHELGED